MCTVQANTINFVFETVSLVTLPIVSNVHTMTITGTRHIHFITCYSKMADLLPKCFHFLKEKCQFVKNVFSRYILKIVPNKYFIIELPVGPEIGESLVRIPGRLMLFLHQKFWYE